MTNQSKGLLFAESELLLNKLSYVVWIVILLISGLVKARCEQRAWPVLVCQVLVPGNHSSRGHASPLAIIITITAASRVSRVTKCHATSSHQDRMVLVMSSKHPPNFRLGSSGCRRWSYTVHVFTFWWFKFWFPCVKMWWFVGIRSVMHKLMNCGWMRWIETWMPWIGTGKISVLFSAMYADLVIEYFERQLVKTHFTYQFICMEFRMGSIKNQLFGELEVVRMIGILSDGWIFENVFMG